MASLHRFALLIAALSLAPAAAAAGPAVYKWTDEDGITHYTQQPPLGREAERINPGSTTGPAQPPAADAGSSDNPEQAEGDGPASVAEFCQQVRERVEALASEGPVSVRQEDDSLQRLAPEERARQLEQGRGQLAEHCQDEAAGSA